MCLQRAIFLYVLCHTDEKSVVANCPGVAN